MKKSIHPLQILAAIWCIGLASLTGCTSTKTKLAAANSVTELQSQLEKQDDSHQKAVESLIRRTLEIHRDALRQRWALRRAEIRLKVYDAFEAQLTKQRKALADEINKALAPIEKNLTDGINSESANGAAGAERANALRLQLAVTLAETQNAAGKSELELEQHVGELRATLLKEVDDEFKTPPGNIDVPVTDAEVTAVVADYQKKCAEFRTQLKESTDSLRDFVTVDEPWKLFLKGLVGESIYGLIEPKLTRTIADTQSKVESTLDKLTASLLQKMTAQANSIPKKG